MTRPQDTLVFTLNDDTPAAPPPAAGTAEGWEQGLERLQQKRRHLPKQAQQPPTVQSNRHPAVAFAPAVPAEPAAAPAPAVPPAPRTARQSVPGAGRARLNPDEQKESYQAYLEYWRQRHNLQAAAEADLDDPQILFQEDWLSAQHALRVGRDEPVAEQATVWLGGHRQPAVTPGQEVADRIEAAAEPSAGSGAPAPDAAELAAAAEKIVLLNAYSPPPGLQHKILCLSERILLERLAEKLHPHLADAVSGMVKTVLQRQTALMVQNMQQAFLDEVPRLVDDVLAYNLARALAAVKKEQLQP